MFGVVWYTVSHARETVPATAIKVQQLAVAEETHADEDEPP
jgi:hypothetical protein